MSYFVTSARIDLLNGSQTWRVYVIWGNNAYLAALLVRASQSAVLLFPLIEIETLRQTILHLGEVGEEAVACLSV